MCRKTMTLFIILAIVLATVAAPLTSYAITDRMDLFYSYIDTDGEWTFYRGNVGPERVTYNAIYRMRNDGSENTKICDIKDVRRVILVDNKLYFNANGTIYKMDKDGSNRTKIITHGTGQFAISDGWIYYEDYQPWTKSGITDLYRVKLNGTKKKKFFTTDGQLVAWAVDGDSLIYPSSGAIYSLKLSTGKKTKLNIPQIDYKQMMIADGWIYYYQLSAGNRSGGPDTFGGVYRAKPDGSGRTKLITVQWEQIKTDSTGVTHSLVKHDITNYCIKDGWIYYGMTPYKFVNHERSNDAYIAKKPVGGGDEVILASTYWPREISIVGDYVYWQTYGFPNKCYRVKINGADMKEVPWYKPV